MRCPNCGAENADTSKFCKMCGVPLQTFQNGDADHGNWQRDSYLDENYVPTMYIPDGEQQNTVLVNTPPLPPPEPYYNAPYTENYDNGQQGPGRKNNMLLLTALFGILTVVLAICIFLVMKYTFLDRVWKKQEPSNEIAQNESSVPVEPAPSANEPQQPRAEQPAAFTPSPYTPSAPGKGESIIHDYSGDRNEDGRQEEPAPSQEEPEPPREEPEPQEEPAQEATSDYYIIPYSNTQYLTESDLRGLSEWEIKLARNEIYARHGRRFKDPALQEYFDAQRWYVGRYDPEDFDRNHSDELSALEKWNAEFILQYEKDHGLMT